jgi:hypothetical protein
MMRKTISALALAAACGVTVLVPTTASAQYRNPQNRVQQERRLFDRAHRDYHAWNNDESRIYREYLSQHHRRYRPFSRLNNRQQREYWRWRHDYYGRR